MTQKTKQILRNQRMLDLSLIEEKELKENCQMALSNLNEAQIIAFSKILFPIQTTPNPFDLFYNNMSTYYNIRLSKKIQFETITKQVLKKAKDFNQTFEKVLQQFFQTKFMDTFKKRVTKTKAQKPSTQCKTQQTTTQPDNTDRKVITFGQEEKENKQKKIRGMRLSLPQTTASDNRILLVSQPAKQPLPIFLGPKQKKISQEQIENTTTNILFNTTGPIRNMSDQDLCLCGKHVSLIASSKQSYFQCYHCNKNYHVGCMKKTPDSMACCFCQLKKMLPHKQVKKTLFVGLLHKGKKKHDFSIYLTDYDLSIHLKIQVRCLRIKQGCQNVILFPDSVYFMYKGAVIKQYHALHKNSSLKYRKDQPFNLNCMTFKQNKIQVHEYHPGRSNKDERIQPENHLIGIYVTQDKRVDWLLRQAKEGQTLTMDQSREFLNHCLKIGTIGDQLTVQVVKVSLKCILTGERMVLPGRGIFCTHFQCFDLKNYLQLTVGSQIPRFSCPICKSPCYEYRIDSLTYSILQLCKNIPEAAQMIVLRDGQFKLFNQKQQQCNLNIKNVANLPHYQVLKRPNPPKQSIIEQPSAKKKQKIEVIIE